MVLCSYKSNYLNFEQNKEEEFKFNNEAQTIFLPKHYFLFFLPFLIQDLVILQENIIPF